MTTRQALRRMVRLHNGVYFRCKGKSKGCKGLARFVYSPLYKDERLCIGCYNERYNGKGA